jgi:hypothetical protein
MLTTEQARILAAVAVLSDRRDYAPLPDAQPAVTILRASGWLVNGDAAGVVRLPAQPPATVITVHQAVDLDAVMTMELIAYLADSPATRRFDSYPDPAWHTPVAGLYTADVGYGPLDHHIRRADGTSSADRSTCAFKLACEHFSAHGTTEQQRQAWAIWRFVGELVLRQDTQGSLTGQRHDPVERMALTSMIRRLRRVHRDNDAAVVAALSPLIASLFDEAVAHYDAYDAVSAALPAIVRYAGTRVVGVVNRQRSDELSLLTEVVWETYPDAVLLVYVTAWHDTANTLFTISRGVGRRSGTPVNVANLVTQITTRPDLPGHLHAELARWHRENWFAGRGARTRPVPDAPPDDLVPVMSRLLDDLLAAGAATPLDDQHARLSQRAQEHPR